MEAVRKVGRFELEAEAGSGAAGTIYEAKDPATGERAAVKVMRGITVTDGARFEREAGILAQIHHPAVVRYVEHGHTAEGDAYLAMEWLEGEDLRRRLGRAGLSMNESVEVGRRVAEALSAIHDHRLVHRDIKPANIFLCGGRASEAKLIDFGLVRAEEAAIEVTSTGAVVGTPSYMAPEQARGQRTLDARADLFSLGCVLFKCLTGRAPFEGRSVMAVLTKVLLEEAPLLRSLRPDAPPALEDLLARLLHKHPAERPGSAAEVARELGALGPLGDAGEIEPAPMSGPPSALTTGEQRVTAMLLIGATRTGLSAEITLATGTAREEEPDVRALVEEHGGQLDNLLDGTRVVTLAASGAATDQAARVARCALSLRAVLRGAPMAIATGRSEVARRRPAGDAIERAAALLAGRSLVAVEAARAGEAPPPIALDDLTAALLDPRFDVAENDDGPSLLGLRASETSGRTLLGRVTPMVGREWELGSIETLFRACVEEREARPLLVTGVAGMGKSRLGNEAVRRLRGAFPGVEVWLGRGDPLRAGSALGLLGDVIRGAFGVQEGEPLDDRRRLLGDRVAARVPGRDASWVAALLGEIAGLPFPDDARPALRAARRDPHIMSRELGAAWEALVDGACSAGPLLLVLEDLHWADAPSVRLVGEALSHLQDRPWLVLALGRPEVHEVFPRLWQARSPQEIRLTPLSRRAGERLARQVLGEGAGAETIEQIAVRSEGNAFYLEELIRAVAERRGPAGAALPETVLAMIQARLEGLDAVTRRALRAASIFGDVFWAGGVDGLLGGSAPSPGWIDALIAAEILVARPSSRFAGERELGFRHALLREGAYSTLTEGDRLLGHKLAGEWLERHGESDALVLARHFEIAMDEARAARFYRAAAAQALRAADVDGATARAERALAQASTDAERIECLSLLSEAHGWRDDWSRAVTYADEVVRLSPPGSEAWVNAMSQKQSAALTMGRADELLPVVMALMTAEAVPEAAPTLAKALAVAVFVLCLAAQVSLAEGLLAKITALVEGYAARDPVANGSLELSRAWIAAWGRGDAWAALRHARAAKAWGESAHDRRHTAFARVYVAMSQWSLGMLAEAEEELVAVGSADGDDLLAVLVGFYLAPVLCDRGSVAEARALALRRIEAGRARGGAVGALREAEGRWQLGEAAAREGELAEAERELDAAVKTLGMSVLAWQLAGARLVEVRLRLGKVSEALSLAREVASSREGSGAHGIRGTQVRLMLAEALEAAGEHEKARAALRAAWDDLQARASRIDDAEARERFLSGVPENAQVAERAREWGIER